MTPRTPDEEAAARKSVDDATTGERWFDFLEWSDRRVQGAIRDYPHIPPDRLPSLAGAAYGYAVTPDYPSDDRDEILDRMLSGWQGTS